MQTDRDFSGFTRNKTISYLTIFLTIKLLFVFIFRKSIPLGSFSRSEISIECFPGSFCATEYLITRPLIVTNFNSIIVFSLKLKVTKMLSENGFGRMFTFDIFPSMSSILTSHFVLNMKISEKSLKVLVMNHL